jgi:hypothetical protein
MLLCARHAPLCFWYGVFQSLRLRLAGQAASVAALQAQVHRRDVMIQQLREEQQATVRQVGGSTGLSACICTRVLRGMRGDSFPACVLHSSSSLILSLTRPLLPAHPHPHPQAQAATSASAMEESQRSAREASSSASWSRLETSLKKQVCGCRWV